MAELRLVGDPEVTRYYIAARDTSDTRSQLFLWDAQGTLLDTASHSPYKSQLPQLADTLRVLAAPQNVLSAPFPGEDRKEKQHAARGNNARKYRPITIDEQNALRFYSGMPSLGLAA